MEPEDKIQMSTLSGCMNHLREKDFTEDFNVVDNSLVGSRSDRSFAASEVKIVDFYRFEGESDPADSSIMYAIETSSGLKGVLIDAYGPYANSKITRFIKDVEDIHKKEHK